MAGGKSRLLRNNDFAKNHSSIGLAGGAGLKILCPLKTCGFDSHLGHKQKAASFVVLFE